MMRELAEERAEIYNIFSNANRLLIFWLLLDGEMSVNEIAETIDASMQNTSQHLRLMKSRNILETRRNGKEIYYMIADTEAANICRRINRYALP